MALTTTRLPDGSLQTTTPNGETITAFISRGQILFKHSGKAPDGIHLAQCENNTFFALYRTLRVMSLPITLEVDEMTWMMQVFVTLRDENFDERKKR